MNDARGFAGDYVTATWLMLQHHQPDHFVVATGEAHCVQEFCEHALDRVGLDYRDHVVIDERFFRPIAPLTAMRSSTRE